jgi:hypothetical protein
VWRGAYLLSFSQSGVSEVALVPAPKIISSTPPAEPSEFMPWRSAEACAGRFFAAK